MYTAIDKLSSGASIDVLANSLQLTRLSSNYEQWKKWVGAPNNVTANMFQLLQLTQRGRQDASSDILQRYIFLRYM
jgi:hypothetical protein